MTAATGFSTFSMVGPPPPEAAAGAAFDPFIVTGGSAYPYAPTIDAMVQLDNSSLSGGIDVYAVDSTVFTSGEVSEFLDDGSPFDQTLWLLDFGAAGPLGGTSDVSVAFELNPLALQEIVLPSSWLSSLPGYSPSLTNDDIAKLVDAAVDASVSTALTFDGSTVSLQNFAPFPDRTQFEPASNVEYAEGVDAGLNAVPEPATFWLLAVGLLGLFGLGRVAARSQFVLTGEVIEWHG